MGTMPNSAFPVSTASKTPRTLLYGAKDTDEPKCLSPAKWVKVAGGPRKAAPFLEGGTFLLLNGDFLIDRHPQMDNVWLVGGGSGHGFKHGPAIGDYVAARLDDGAAVDRRFSLATKQTVQKRTVY